LGSKGKEANNKVPKKKSSKNVRTKKYPYPAKEKKRKNPG